MPTYLYEDIISDLQEKIRNGTYPPGVRLPSRKAMCEIYECSEAPIVRALLELRHQGLTTSLIGSGTFVADPLPEDFQ
jgi:DNA-binding GntR family transcriptional regulator